jgi:hypothetical protein
MKTTKAIVIGILGCALAAMVGGCGDDGNSQTSGKDNDAYLKAQLVGTGTWDREFDDVPAIYEKMFKDDGTVALKEFRKTDAAAPPKSAEVRFHRRFKNLPLYEETAGTWDIREGQIYYKLALPNGTEMPQQYKIEHITATEFVQSSQGVDDKIEESYVSAKMLQTARPIATTAPAPHKT